MLKRRPNYMPYITKERAQELTIKQVTPAYTKGELNYQISSLIACYIFREGATYKTISDAIGAASDAAEEARRRVLNLYEEKKINDTANNVDPYKDITRLIG